MKKSLLALIILASSTILAGCNGVTTSSQDLKTYASDEQKFQNQFNSLETESRTLISEYQGGQYDATLADNMQKQLDSIESTANRVNVPEPMKAANDRLQKSLKDFAAGLADFKHGATNKNDQMTSLQDIDSGAKLLSQSSTEFTGYLGSYESVLQNATSNTAS